MTYSKNILSNSLRKLNLIHFADLVRYYINKAKNGKKNENFRKNNPTVIIPPDYLMYESFQIDYEKYFIGGNITANWLVNIIKKHKALENLDILDWGCGPARVIRHLPNLLNSSNTFYGTDYNPKTINWCTRHLNNVKFKVNHLEPPLEYENNSFDVIYGISIFTHLSEDLHFKWINELERVLKYNGILILTLQGDHFRIKLAKNELEQYNSGKLVIRGNVKNGHRVFSSYHPREFVNVLFKNFEILEHIIQVPENKNDTPQDTWVLRKQ